MYRYTPSLAAAILFLVLFSILTLLHIYIYLRHRRSSTIYIILGGLCTFPPNLELVRSAYLHGKSTNIMQVRLQALLLV